MHSPDEPPQPIGELVVSSLTDPAYNLALEEHLFETLPRSCVRFLLYVNDPCVVIGKHQNPWREADPEALVAAGIPLFRRITGGGTVYHDTGNLNYSFMVHDTLFDKRANLELVVSCLRRLGGHHDPGGSSAVGGTAAPAATDFGDILVGDRKVGGTALCHRKGRSLQHGTLLVSSDLGRLRSSLRRQELDIRTHAVASRPARVANLADSMPGLSLDLCRGLLSDAFLEKYPGRRVPDAEVPRPADITAAMARHGGLEWVLGKTPSFTAVFSVAQSIPGGTMAVQVAGGRVRSIEGAVDDRFRGLTGKYFSVAEIRRQITDVEAAAI